MLRSAARAALDLIGAEDAVASTSKNEAPHKAGLRVLQAADQLPFTGLPSTVPSCSTITYSLPSVSTWRSCTSR